MNGNDITRRDALIMAGGAALAPLQRGDARAADTTSSAAKPAPVAKSRSGANAVPAAPTIFSRHLQWASVDEAIEVAVSAGYGSIAWTIRPGAHIEPENVTRDLPRVVEQTHRAGLGTPVIVPAIVDADSPYAAAIIETAAGLGIHTYRAQTNAAAYDFAGDVPAQLAALRPRMASLEQLNSRYGATGLLHAHGGMLAGAIWDTWLLVREFDPNLIGINFDTGFGLMWDGLGWMEAVRFSRPYIHSLSLKDFRWQQQEVSGRRRMRGVICPPGEGVVDFQEMLSYFQSTGFRGPVEVQFEYLVDVPGRSTPVSLMAVGADVGKWKLEMPKADFVALLKRDADFYIARLQEVGLTPT